jgi:hypothetical protein
MQHDFTDFIRLAACVMTSKGYGEAARRAEEKGWGRVADTLQKATVAGATTGASSIGTLLGSFMAAVRNIGVVDRVAAEAMRIPDRLVGRVTVFTSVAASSVSEGAAKPLKYIALTAADFTPVKVACQVVLSNETIAALQDEGLRILGQELKNSVAVGSDTAFLSALSGNSGEAAGLDTWQGANDDLEELLRQLNLGAGSAPFIIVTPSFAKSLAARGIVNGVESTLGWNGGSYAGVPILVSDAQTPGRISAVDATGLAVVLGDLELRSTEQALIEMSDAPSQTSGTSVSAVSQVSMFQTDSRCLLAERRIAVKPIRAGSWAHLTGAVLGAGSDSPMNPL